MATISFITHAIAYAFPAFTFTWVLPEFRDAVVQELGPLFLNEFAVISFFQNDLLLFL